MRKIFCEIPLILNLKVIYMKRHFSFSYPMYFGFYVVLFYFITLSSCNPDSKKADAVLQSVEDIVEQYPDSAFLLLDSIDNPYELNEGQQAKYFLLSVESKYKTEKDISKDSLIFKAKDYFRNKNDLKHLALATFYSGRALEALQKPQEALNCFLESESIAIAAKESSLTGFIQYNIIIRRDYMMRLLANSSYQSKIKKGIKAVIKKKLWR